MDDQKRQKVMLGALAVAALAAGGFFYMNRSSADVSAQDAKTGYTGRRARKTSDAEPRRASRTVRAPKRERNKATTGRKERTARPTAGKNTRRSRRGKEAKTKKKKLVPAA